MPVGRFRYCWDSCVFISLLTGEGRTPEEIRQLRELESLVDIGAVTVFTPSITLIEVLSCKLTDAQELAFKSLLERSNVLPVSVTRRIADRAREIRNHFRTKELEIAVPDAIQIATALVYGATALHTYDGCGKRQRKTDLLKLEMPLADKYTLKICKPEPPPPDKPEAIGAADSVQVPGDLFPDPEEPEQEQN